MEKKAVAVVGSSRQLGALVVNALVGHDQISRIVAIDSMSPISASRKLEPVELPSGSQLEALLAGCKALVHTGELPPIGFGVTLDSVLKAAVHAGIRKLVCVSSLSAYGAIPDHPVPLVEDSPRRPPFDGRPYRGASDMEQILDELERTYPQLQIVRLRPGLIFGMRSTTLPARAMRQGWSLELSHAALPVVWDEDVASAVVLALEKEVRGAFNLVVGETQPLADLAKTAGLRSVRLPASTARKLIQGQGTSSQTLGKRCDKHWLAVAGVSMYLSNKRAYEELGWNPICTSSPDVVERYLRCAPRHINLRIAAFFGMLALSCYLPPRFRRDMAAMQSARIRVVFTGEDGGEVGMIFDRGKCRVEFGTLHAPDAVVQLPARLFMEMLAGQADPGTAQETGAIAIQGELGRVLGLGMIQAFRGAAQSKQLWAKPAHWVAHWMGQGVVG